MANLLSNTTVGGNSVITTANIGSYALTSVPANVITTSGGQTIGGITYFSNAESLNLYGIRGRFTNEYIHLYNKVGIGSPNGWGQGEVNTPGFGISTYGGANFAYGNNADSTFNGIVYSTASFRAPIFYDSNDTNYYGDFASTSRFNIAHVNSVVDQSYSRIVNPQGGQSLNNGPQSGAIKIKLPVAASFSNSMMSFTIQIYNYSTGTSRTIRCGGYTYHTTDWYNTFAFQIGDTEAGNLTIRFGKDSTGACVWIGETNSYWDYPNVFVTDVQSGHSQPTSMATGWSITMVTSFDTIQTSRVAYSQITSGNIASQSVSYASTSGSANSVAWTNVSGRPTNVSSFTNDSGYLTSLPSHNHDDRYFTETESDGRFHPLENQRLSTGNSPSFASVSANDVYTTGGWFRNHTNNSGIYWSNTGWHLMPENSSDFRFHSGNSTEAAIRMESSGTTRGYIYVNSSNEIGFLNNGRSWRLKVSAGGAVESYGDFRAPIFYDSADTNYYVDPNGLSTLSHIRLNNNWANAGVNQGAINIRGQYPSMVFRNTVSDSMWLRHMDASGTIQHYYASDGVDSSNWGIKHSMHGNGNFSSIGTHTASQFIGSGAGLTGTASSLSVGYATTAGSATSASQLTKYGDIYGQDWNSYYISNKLIVSAALGMSGANKPPTSYDYGVALSYGEAGGPLLQMYFPENQNNIGTIFRKGTYRTGWNGNWSSWKTLVEQEGNLCTIVGGNAMGLEVHGNVGYNQDPLTYFLLRGQADTSWKALKVRLTGDAGGQDIEFRRIAENGTDSRMWFVPRGGNTVNFEYPIVQPSDSRLKDNITPISTPVDKIKSLRGVEFDWNSGEQVGTHDVGLIAQDVEAVLPEAVTTQEDGYKNLAYTKVIPLLVEAMKEQQAMIEALKAEIELLKNK